MVYKIRKNWATSLDLMLKKPVVMLPFIMVAFLEALALELIYFSSKRPVSALIHPLVKKFFGEPFVHYPGNMVILPRLFYYAHVGIYVLFGVLLTAVSINIFKNIKTNLVLETKTLVKNTLSRYLSFFVFGILMIILIIFIERADTFIYSKLMGLVVRFFPQIGGKLFFLGLVLFLFLSNIVMYTFLILTVPLMVIREKSFFKALAGSISLGWRNFLSIFALIFLPFLIYLPIAFLKSATPRLIEKTFPEITLYIVALGIALAVFLDCFIYVCACQFLWENREGPAS